MYNTTAFQLNTVSKRNNHAPYMETKSTFYEKNVFSTYFSIILSNFINLIAVDCDDEGIEMRCIFQMMNYNYNLEIVGRHNLVFVFYDRNSGVCRVQRKDRGSSQYLESRILEMLVSLAVCVRAVRRLFHVLVYQRRASLLSEPWAYAMYKGFSPYFVKRHASPRMEQISG